MTKWVVTMTTVVDNAEPDDRSVQCATDALTHAKDIISGRILTLNRVQIDIDEVDVTHNRYTGTFNVWFKRDI